MSIRAKIRTCLIGATLLAPFSVAQAVIVDFTDSDWSGVGGTSYTVGGIRLTSSNGNMTFNDPDGAAGCGDGGAGQTAVQLATGLACTGDGIGIGDDEITQAPLDEQLPFESLTVEFLNGPVNVHAIHLLDLFGAEQTGEMAQITWGGNTIVPDSDCAPGPDCYAGYTGGGYWEVDFPFGGLVMAGITEFTLKGVRDGFSDYSLARIDFSPVPVPAAFWLFGTALLGFISFSRRTRV